MSENEETPLSEPTEELNEKQEHNFELGLVSGGIARYRSGHDFETSSLPNFVDMGDDEVAVGRAQPTSTRSQRPKSSKTKSKGPRLSPRQQGRVDVVQSRYDHQQYPYQDS